MAHLITIIGGKDLYRNFDSFKPCLVISKKIYIYNGCMGTAFGFKSKKENEI